MANSLNSAFVVQPPFDAKSLGDCLLQSPDGTRFKVHRAILSTASTIFHDMFNMPSDRIKNEADTPIIPLQEDAETLQAMLQILYPIEPPTIKSLLLAEKLVTAFDKYFISTAKLRHHLRGVLSLEESLEKDPLACFAISWKLRLETETMLASRYTHTWNLSNVTLAEAVVSLSGDMGALVALLDLRSRRERELDDLLDLINFNSHFNCRSHGEVNVSFLRDRERRARLKEALNVPFPICADAEYFLGFKINQPPRYGVPCTKCHQMTKTFRSLTKIVIEGALRSYPQTISG